MKIQTKLFILLTGFSCTLVVIFILFTQWSINKGMLEFANKREVAALESLQQELKIIYLAQNSWQALSQKPQRFRELLSPRKNNQTANNNHAKRLHRNRHYVLLDANKQLIAGPFRQNRPYHYVPIEINSDTVGYIAFPLRRHLRQGIELDFVKQQQQYLWLFALVVIAVIALFAIPLARHIVRPIKRLVVGIHALTLGDYRQQTFEPRGDEFGQLQNDQNNLARTLNLTQATQNQWLANTSHELRTPLAIIKGEIEAMLDGVRALDKANLNSINQEVDHLTLLIDDLQQLSSLAGGSMHFNKTPVDLVSTIKNKYNNMTGYLSKHDINLLLDLKPTPAPIELDVTRFNQLLENITQNAVKYAGNASTLKVSVETLPNQVELTIEDNGNGVPASHLEQLFEYLYRVEASRNKNSGGFGLGLAICKHIVEGHQGSIEARASDLGGLAIVIRLPLCND